MPESQRLDRRSFFKRAAGTGLVAPAFIKNLMSQPPSGKQRLASFGADGMAYETLNAICGHPNAVLSCVAEVDQVRTAKVKAKFPDAKIYSNWREMLDKERKNIDMACVATPDHMHAAITMTALRLGIPCYTQKPLTHDIYEARMLREMADKMKLPTQMGIQRHSCTEYKTAVKLIQSGIIGKIKEVHAWDYKKWGDPTPFPDRSDPVPPTMDWNQWIGTAADRPFINGFYHPSEWRKRVDFGTATFGDMGCHIYDPPFTALALTSPISLVSEGPPPNGQSWATNAIVHYTFPGTQYTEGKTVDVTWTDGDERPPAEILAMLGTRRAPNEGSIFVGTEGVMLLQHTAMPVLFPEEKFKNFKITPTRGRGGIAKADWQGGSAEADDHYFQFVDAVAGKTKTSTPFDYSGPLSEAVLLGSVATRFPKQKLMFDSAKLKFTGNAEATAFVKRKYRKGFTVEGLS
jgi:predicted dehydrogenase